VLYQVGAGTLGPVFRALDAGHDRLVAVKLFRLDLPPQRLHQLVDEFEWLIAAQIAPRGIAAPIATGTDGINIYLVREFFAADSLDVVVRDRGPAPPASAMHVATQLGEALDAAASLDVLHGALHPRDVMIASDEVRMTDLGVCAALERVGVLVPVRRPYTAPERLAGGAWDRRADIFGLSALTYELLWGRRPILPGPNGLEKLTNLPGGDVASLTSVFERGLAIDPARRFETAKAFCDALRASFADLSAAPMAVRPGDVAANEPLVLRPPAGFRELRLPLDGPEPFSEPDLGALDSFAIRETGEPLRGEDQERVLSRVEEEPAVTSGDFEPRQLRHAPLRPRVDPAPTIPFLARLPSFRPPLKWLVSAFALIGILVGFGGGYLVGSGRRSLPADDQSAAQTPTPGDTQAVAAPPSPVDSSLPSEKVERKATPPRAAVAQSEAVTNAAGRSPSPAPANRAPVAAAPPAPPTNAGRLLVRSTPAGASVVVDGSRQGVTPATLKNLSKGAHKVRVELDGYVAENRSVTITDDRLQTLSMELGPVRAARAPRAPRVPDDRVAVTPARTTAVSSFAGVLIVESLPPGAEVFVDGKAVGITPLVLARVNAGEHAVRLEREGYRRWSASVRIVTDERNRVTASLER
jgi:serine/threonine protein kinase